MHETADLPNTRIDYGYRDGHGNRVDAADLVGPVVLPGRLSPRQVAVMARHMEAVGEGDGAERQFLPSQVGLPDLPRRWAVLRGYPYPADDHPWHILERVSPTVEPASVPMSANALFTRVATVRAWDEASAACRLGIGPDVELPLPLTRAEAATLGHILGAWLDASDEGDDAERQANDRRAADILNRLRAAVAGRWPKGDDDDDPALRRPASV